MEKNEVRMEGCVEKEINNDEEMKESIDGHVVKQVSIIIF